MADIRIGSLMVDEDTGAVLVKTTSDVDIGDVNLLNIASDKIDPATEDKQDDLIATTTAYTTGGHGAQDCASADLNYTLGAQACRAAVVAGHPDNGGRLWVGIGAAAVDGQGTALAAGDRIGFAVSNTNMVNVLAKSAGDDLLWQWVN